MASGDPGRPVVRFEPLRPASRRRMIVAVVLGPVLWLIALIVAAALFEYSSSIALGLVVTLASFVVSLAVLAVLHALRRRQERRYANRG